MKMSDDFELPVTEERVANRLSAAWLIQEKAKPIAHAINQHDTLVDLLRQCYDVLHKAHVSGKLSSDDIPKGLGIRVSIVLNEEDNA